MRIGLLGTGMVGTALGDRLVGLGHDVVMGARSADNEKAAAWAAAHDERARAGTFADAAAHGEVVVNATAGVASLRALDLAGADNLTGKVLVDVANPIASYGAPPTLDPVGDDSLGERIQSTHPGARVVKTLNTVNCQVMVDPSRLPGDTDVFVAGDDPAAKEVVRGLLREFGWPDGSIRDLGGIVAARGLEMYLIFWIQTMVSLGTADFNIRVVSATSA